MYRAALGPSLRLHDGSVLTRPSSFKGEHGELLAPSLGTSTRSGSDERAPQNICTPAIFECKKSAEMGGTFELSFQLSE